MSDTKDHRAQAKRSWRLIGLMVTLCVPGVFLRLAGIHTASPAMDAAIFGLAVLAAAFLLAWAAESAETEISQGLALATIALIAVLPEYAVDAVLAWEAGADPEVAKEGFAIANMTGGNRLLIGLAWPLVFGLFFFRTRIKELVVDPHRALEITFLAIATMYVILIPLRSHLTLIDTIILVSLFIIYVFFTARLESEEAELVGPAETIGRLPRTKRRIAILSLLIVAAGVIFAVAEPFAHGLIETGERFGISEFFLLQWLAPLASEAPEVVVACLLAWRGRAALGMGALISSKVNQWTLLIGTLPIAYSLSAGQFELTGGLPLNHIQQEEIFLTAAQSAFAIAVFANLRLGVREAVALFVLFATQLFITNEQARVYYGVAYLVLCAVLLIIGRREARPTVKTAWALIRGREVAEAE
jgi:cation:H+ antiporter